MDIRTPFTVSMVIRGGSLWRYVCGFSCLPPAGEGWKRCWAQWIAVKATDRFAPSSDNSATFPVVQIFPLLAHQELHQLVQCGPNVQQNQNLFPYLRSEPGAFSPGQRELTAQSTDFKEASHEEIYLFSLNNGHKSLTFDSTGTAASQVLQCSVLFQRLHFCF